MRRMMWMAGVTAVLAVLAGCADRYEYNRRTMRFEQVGPRSRPRIPVSDAEIGQIPPPAERPLPVDLSARQKSALARSQVNRLYLGDASVQTQSLPNLYSVRQADLAKMAEVLTLLFPGQGPGGSERIRWVVYADTNTCERALAFAPRLDVVPQPAPSVVPSPTTGSQSDWEQAIGLVYGSEFPRRMDPDIRFRAVSLLQHVTEDRSAPTDLRWSAAIVAANLQTRFEPHDPVAAAALLGQAGQVVRGQDYLALVLRYHHVRLLQTRGQSVAARKEALAALNTFQSCEGTDCFQDLQAVAQTRGRQSIRGEGILQEFRGQPDKP